jgi:hypothetical protein
MFVQLYQLVHASVTVLTVTDGTNLKNQKND